MVAVVPDDYDRNKRNSLNRISVGVDLLNTRFFSLAVVLLLAWTNQLISQDPKGADEPKPETNQNDAAADKPADPSPNPNAGEPRNLHFNFQFSNWDPVLKWLAKTADLSLQMDAPPPGSFNYVDQRSFTVSEAIDLINGVLQFRGYTLVRNQRMLIVVNLEDGIPPGIIQTITPEELDDRGKYEIVKCLFPLGNLTPDDIETEVRPLISDPTALKVMPTSRQVLVQETGGNLRMIRSVFSSAQENREKMGGDVQKHTLQFITSDEVLAITRPLLGIEEEEFSLPDGQLNIALEPLGQRLFYSGQPEFVERFKQIIELIDVDPGIEDGPPPEQVQLETHTVRADPTTALQVLQTIFAGQEGMRLATDPVTGNIIALAKPSQHATIRGILGQMQKDAVSFDVIQLRRYDPQSVVLMLNKLLGKDNEENANKGPTFDGDPTTMQLVVRGTAAEIEQIQEMVNKIDPPLSTDGADFRSNVRLIPLTGRQLTDVLDMAELMWPSSKRKNKIRVVTPSESKPSLDQRGIHSAPQRKLPEIDPPGQNPIEAAPPKKPEVEPQPKGDKAAGRHNRRIRVRFVGFQDVPKQDGESQPAAKPSNEPAEKENKDSDEAKAPDIVITIRSNGIVISSDDLDALDDFEDLLRSLMSSNTFPDEPTVFYLKHAKADEAAGLLNSILGLSSGGGGGGLGGLLGGAAQNLVGGMGGDLLGGLLGGAGDSGASSSLQTSGTVSITPEVRLNALVVQANAADTDLIEQLLEIIDQEGPPQEPDTAGQTYIIPVIYMTAGEMSNIVKQAFPENIVGATTGQQRQPNPQDLIRALTGRGQRGRGEDSVGEARKMTVGVDERSNSLVVTGPEHLYKKVLALVEQLDREGLGTSETFTVVQLNGTVNPETLRKSLTSILGDQAQTSSTSASGNSSQTSPRPTSNQQPAQQNIEDIRRRIEFFRALQGGRGPGGSPGGIPGAGGGRGPGGGGFRGGGIPGGGRPSGR